MVKTRELQAEKPCLTSFLRSILEGFRAKREKNRIRRGMKKAIFKPPFFAKYNI